MNDKARFSLTHYPLPKNAQGKTLLRQGLGCVSRTTRTRPSSTNTRRRWLSPSSEAHRDGDVEGTLPVVRAADIDDSDSRTAWLVAGRNAVWSARRYSSHGQRRGVIVALRPANVGAEIGVPSQDRRDGPTESPTDSARNVQTKSGAARGAKASSTSLPMSAASMLFFTRLVVAGGSSIAQGNLSRGSPRRAETLGKPDDRGRRTIRARCACCNRSVCP